MEYEQIKKAKRGDKQAFEEIIMKHIDYFYRIAYVILKNEEDASDAVSNAVLKAYTKIKLLLKYIKTKILMLSQMTEACLQQMI